MEDQSEYGEIINIEKNMPHKLSEMVCSKCLKRWVAVRPEMVLLKDIECACGEVGFVIETGEFIN